MRSNFQERRKSERLAIPIHLDYAMLPGKNILYQAMAQNIGGGGAAFRLAHPLLKGARLKVLLYFPGDRRAITAVSEIVWCKKITIHKKDQYDVGIKYLKIIAPDKERFVFLFCELMTNMMTLGRHR